MKQLWNGGHGKQYLFSLVSLRSSIFDNVLKLNFMGGNKTFILSLFFIVLFVGVSAQDKDEVPDLVTDRPDRTESSVSVPHKSLQLETGFSATFDDISGLKSITVGYGESLLRYGIFEGMELRLAMDYSTMKTFAWNSNIYVMQKGISPAALGLKIDLTEQAGWIPEMALLVHINATVFNSDFESTYATPNMILSASHTITSRFSLGCNLGIEWADNDAAPVKIYSVVAGFSLSDRIGAFVETFGNFGNGEFQNVMDGGFTFLILPNLQYDISGGLGVTASSPDFFISSGLSLRLP